MKRIWMNHWFSTAYNIIELLKADGEDAYVIGTNTNEYSVIMKMCDEWYREPSHVDENYINFCLDFCKEHDIQYFVPRRGMLEISKNKEQFEELGVKVMLDDLPIISTFNYKQKAYEFFKDKHIGIVPDFEIVNTKDNFKEAYDKLSGKYERVCFKFVKDEGGQSFRLIDNNKKGYAALFKTQSTGMALVDVLAALSEREEFDPIMVMPFLSGDEISVDCLNTDSGLITLPRVKGYNRYEVLKYDDEIIDICKDFQKKVGLECPYNIQFKYLDGIPYFLEVNTRMSGGIHMACQASGVNIPQLALKKLAGEDVSWNWDKKEKVLAQALEPIVLN